MPTAQGLLHPGMPGEPWSFAERKGLQLISIESDAFYEREMAYVHGWGPSLGIAAASFAVGAGVVALVAWQAHGRKAKEDDDEQATEDCPGGN